VSSKKIDPQLEDELLADAEQAKAFWREYQRLISSIGGMESGLTRRTYAKPVWARARELAAQGLPAGRILDQLKKDFPPYSRRSFERAQQAAMKGRARKAAEQPQPQPKPTPKPEPQPKATPKAKAPPKPRPKLTPEQRQEQLAKKFAQADTRKFWDFFGKPMPTHSGIYFTGTERIEVRMVRFQSYIARCFSGGTSTYRQLNQSQVRKLVQAVKTKDEMLVMRRRMRELHSDKTGGRALTDAELEEFTALAKALDEARKRK
jgi:hypothetical protein